MFLFDILFGKRDKTAAAAPQPVAAVHETLQVAPGTTIQYHPELIEKFRNDHQFLLQLFGNLRDAAAAGDVATAATLLDEFRGALQGHLLTENVRLYVYLEHALAGDPPSYALMHQFRHEMDEIGKAVVAFLGKYRDLAARPDQAPAFVEELEGVGKVLVRRIRAEEETLYPLYAPI